MQIDPDALPEDTATLHLMLRTVLLQQGALAAENDKMRLLIQRLTRHQFGRRSEQLTPDQLQLALEELEQTIAANQAGQDAVTAAAGLARKPRTEASDRNHGAPPAHLPRYEVVIDVEDRACPCCGHALHAIGELRTEQLDMVPSQLRVRVTRRPRYACHGCEGAVVVAAAPDRPVDGGMPTEALVAHVVVSKFADALPLYRQAQMLERQGIKLDRSTLANWVGRACWWLTPLYEQMLGTVLAAPKVFADDTTLPVLDPGRGRTKTGRLWCYAVDDRPWGGPGHPMAAYVYSDDRRNERPAGHLAGFRGVLQVDGYSGFKALASARADASVTLAFCWSHMRRHFYDQFVSDKSPLAAEVLARVRALYAIEAEIRGHPAEHRRAVRQERSQPIVEALHGWLHDQVSRVPSGRSSKQRLQRLNSWSPSTDRGSAHDRGDYLAARQRGEVAFDPGRAGRLAPCLPPLPAVGDPWRVGQDHGSFGGAGRAEAGFCLHRRHDLSRSSEGLRCPARQSLGQRLRLSLRPTRDVAIKGEALGRSRGGLGTKIVGVCDAAGRLVDFLLAPGQAHELAPSLILLHRLSEPPSWVLADMACDARAFRSDVRAMGAIPVVPSRRGTKQPEPCPDYIYRHRNLIERCWSRLKECRAVATRYDKTATSYAAGIAIAASLDWIKDLLR